MSARPRVFTVPSSAPFLSTLARALLDGELIAGFAPRNDPLALAGATVYLPTRRASRAFAEAILAALGQDATLLPKIVPLGDADEDALAFADIAGMPERPSPISPTARRLVLAKIVRDFALMKERLGEPTLSTSQSAALQLADELARLFDDLTIAGIDPRSLSEAAFIPEGLDKHWQDSLVFVEHVYPAWQRHLKDNGLVDPTVWRDLLLTRETERLAADGGPVIAAGSTGTIPAVARLITAIAKRPDGAVVLPGLDQRLDGSSFAQIEHDDMDPSFGHPQFGLKRLIARIGIARDEVVPLGVAAEPAREAMLSEAFRPAATTERWRERGTDFDAEAVQALEDTAVIEAADPREEALSLAVALRECMETPDATAALVTPDRALARRVAAELRRWQVEVDDSGGTALAESDAGRLARLAVTAVAEEFAPVPLVALLRHPLAGFAADAVDALEIAALRGPRPAAGADGLRRAIANARMLASTGGLHRRDARAKLTEQNWQAAADLAARVAQILEPLLALHRANLISFGELIAAHCTALRNLGLDFTAREPHDVRALAQAFERLTDATRHAAPLTLADYADAFPQLLAGEPPVRPAFDRGARIRILGPLEARLLEADRVLLGGLNEGTWPPETRSDAWLNRPMRKALGLDLPERRVGLAAHDFAQAMSSRRVIVSRAKKQDGVETVASRFLQRISAVVPDAAWQSARERGAHYLELARTLERTKPVPAAARPAPRPPAVARPDRLSVTEIETLIRDPYSIYARHVLRLYPLEEIDADPGAAERGTILHEAFAAFGRDFPDRLPAEALDELLARGDAAFAAHGTDPGTRAIWRPRFRRAAEWFVGQEAERRSEIAQIFSEAGGRISFDAGGRPFTLTARADRIDLRRDGAAALADYKTGEPPSLPQVLSGLAPQLALEAAILRAGGFASIAGGTTIAEIAVIRVSGGQPPGEWCVLDVSKARGDVAARAKTRGIDSANRLADDTRKRLEALVGTFAAEATPYLSIPRPQWRGRFGEYDHLARIKEWSANETEEEW
ncbi:MAG TPA: double-strand break repair protein AddB [Xanthobacteraceae bacterium]|nr:double-strand break repair protein AddB [Xanthobacteraceae bacterium]